MIKLQTSEHSRVQFLLHLEWAGITVYTGRDVYANEYYFYWWNWLEPGNRGIGYNQFWHDGPHTLLWLWFFNIGWCLPWTRHRGKTSFMVNGHKEPQWAVFAETGPMRLRYAYSYLGMKWYEFVIGLRSWIDCQPSCVYSFRFGNRLDAAEWVTMLRERPEDVRAAFIKARKEMFANWRE